MGCKSGQGEHVRERELRGDAGAEQNLENGRNPRDGKRVRLGFRQPWVGRFQTPDFTRENGWFSRGTPKSDSGLSRRSAEGA